MQQGDALAHGDQGSLMGCGDAACGKSTVSVGGFRCAAALVSLDGLGGALSAGLSASSGQLGEREAQWFREHHLEAV